MAVKRYRIKPGFTFNQPDGQKLRAFLPQEASPNPFVLYGKDGAGRPVPTDQFETDEENVKGQEHKVECLNMETPKETAPKEAPKVEDKEVKGAEEKKESKPADGGKKKSGRRGRPPKKKPAE